MAKDDTQPCLCKKISAFTHEKPTFILHKKAKKKSSLPLYKIAPSINKLEVRLISKGVFMVKILDADLIKGHFIITDGKRVLVDSGRQKAPFSGIFHPSISPSSFSIVSRVRRS